MIISLIFNNTAIKTCLWFGEAPICQGLCPDGWKTDKLDDRGDGKKCWTGKKALCCPTEAAKKCLWFGTSPFCAGTCPKGWLKEKTDNKGDGKLCLVGAKAYCCTSDESKFLKEKKLNKS